jgi:hypothetical protein
VFSSKTWNKNLIFDTKLTVEFKFELTKGTNSRQLLKNYSHPLLFFMGAPILSALLFRFLVIHAPTAK